MSPCRWRWRATWAWVALLFACGEPDPGTVFLSDVVDDPRLRLEGLGDLDPGAGLPELGRGACRREGTSVRDGSTRVRRITRDADGRVLQWVEESRGLRAVDAITYDADGRPVRLDWLRSEAQGTIRLDFDGARLVAAEDVGEGGTRWSYRWLGEHLARIEAWDDEGERFATDFVRDPSGGLVSKRVGRAELSAWHLTAVDYAYDDAGRLLTKRLRASGGERTARYTWSADGLLTAVDWSDGETLVETRSLTYDAERRVVEVARSEAGGEVTERERFWYTCDADAAPLAGTAPLCPDR